MVPILYTRSTFNAPALYLFTAEEHDVYSDTASLVYTYNDFSLGLHGENLGKNYVNDAQSQVRNFYCWQNPLFVRWATSRYVIVECLKQHLSS